MDLSLKDLKELLTPQVNSAYFSARGKAIVILQRGWVMVGDLVLTDTECTLSNASVIRNWGTTKGIGEIALNGPTPNTILDPVGAVTFHRLTSIAEIQCNEERWK